MSGRDVYGAEPQGTDRSILSGGENHSARYLSALPDGKNVVAFIGPIPLSENSFSSRLVSALYGFSCASFTNHAGWTRRNGKLYFTRASRKLHDGFKRDVLLVKYINGQQNSINPGCTKSFRHFVNLPLVTREVTVCDNLPLWNAAVTGGCVYFTDCVCVQQRFAAERHDRLNLKFFRKPFYSSLPLRLRPRSRPPTCARHWSSVYTGRCRHPLLQTQCVSGLCTWRHLFLKHVQLWCVIPTISGRSQTAKW